jgi:salicylate hydroxylase
LQFAHGDSVEVDIVVAADGIQSILQKYVVEPKPPEYSGVRAYRGLISREKLPGWRRRPTWFGWGMESTLSSIRFAAVGF